MNRNSFYLFISEKMYQSLKDGVMKHDVPHYWTFIDHPYVRERVGQYWKEYNVGQNRLLEDIIEKAKRDLPDI